MKKERRVIKIGDTFLSEEEFSCIYKEVGTVCYNKEAVCYVLIKLCRSPVRIQEEYVVTLHGSWIIFVPASENPSWDARALGVEPQVCSIESEELPDWM